MRKLIKAFAPAVVVIVPAEVMVINAIMERGKYFGGGDPIGAIVILGGAWLIGPTIFFLPTIVAGLRGASNYVGILVTNVLGSLVVGVGWLAALIWAFVDRKEESSSGHHQTHY